jgi:hypothetical protein
MAIDLNDPTSALTANAQVKITDKEIEYLQTFLDARDRGGYYMALYQITGNEQCLVQAQVSTFSEGTGGAAWVANYLLQEIKEI